jgi:hypothetical protein
MATRVVKRNKGNKPTNNKNIQHKNKKTRRAASRRAPRAVRRHQPTSQPASAQLLVGGGGNPFWPIWVVWWCLVAWRCCPAHLLLLPPLR